MISFANVLIAVLFLAKLLWTAAIPIAREIEIRKVPIEDRERESKRGVSLALVIDIVLLLALVSISAVTGRGIFHLSAFWLLVDGVGAIAVSVGCCAILSLIPW
jgi:hypothetical protein